MIEGGSTERKTSFPLTSDLFIPSAGRSSNPFEGLSEEEQHRMEALIERYLELEMIKERHAESELRRYLSEEKKRQSIIVISSAFVIAISLSSLVYSILSGKFELLERVISTLVGIFVGGSAAALISARSKSTPEASFQSSTKADIDYLGSENTEKIISDIKASSALIEKHKHTSQNFKKETRMLLTDLENLVSEL